MAGWPGIAMREGPLPSQTQAHSGCQPPASSGLVVTQLGGEGSALDPTHTLSPVDVSLWGVLAPGPSVLVINSNRTP